MGRVHAALPFGLTGCSLLAQLLTTQFAASAGNMASITPAIPNNPALLGLRFYNQAMALDPAANAVGLTVSNAGRAKLWL